jgi:hypothetical protein
MKKIELQKIGEACLKRNTNDLPLYPVCIDENSIIVEEKTQKFIGLYLKEALSNQCFYEQAQGLNFKKSNRTSGLQSQSLIFGAAPEDPLKNLPARLVRNEEKTNRFWLSLLKKANQIFETNLPEKAAEQRKIIKDAIKPFWILPGGLFTSGIINKSTQLMTHTDNGNLENAVSVMFCFKKNIVGGTLALPEYQVDIEIGPGSCFIFDGQSVSHGVRKFIKTQLNSNRYTIVFYALAKLSMAEENQKLENQKFNKKENRKLAK